MEYKIFGPKEGDKTIIGDFMKRMDSNFTPTLASRLNLDEYIEKIYNNATKFTYWDKDKLIALGISYINKAPLESFGAYVVVDPAYESYGLGLDICMKSFKYAKEFGSASFRVKIRDSNTMLNKFYLKQGFKLIHQGTYPNSDIKENELVKNFV